MCSNEWILNQIKKKAHPNALSLYFSVLFSSIYYNSLQHNVVYWHSSWEWNAKHQDKRSTFSLSLLPYSGFKWKHTPSSLSHTHTNTLSLSIFPSPNVSLSPPGGSDWAGWEAWIFLYWSACWITYPFSNGLHHHTQVLAISACTDFLIKRRFGLRKQHFPSKKNLVFQTVAKIWIRVPLKKHFSNPI